MLGDVDAIKARLHSQPALATQPGGIQNWEPLLYVCHTCLLREEPTRLANLVAIATLLLDLGANPTRPTAYRHTFLPVATTSRRSISCIVTGWTRTAFRAVCRRCATS